MAEDLIELGKNKQRWAVFEQPYLPGWSKQANERARRYILQRLTQNQGCLRVSRKLNQLANVTRDKETARVARADQQWISKQGFCRTKGKRR